MHRFKALLLSFGFITCGILILFAINVFPIPGTDSIVFIPPALLFSKGYGLANSLYCVASYTDLTHTGRFNYYVPFFPYLLGLLSSVKPGVKTIFFICSLFSTVNILLYASVIPSFIPAKLTNSIKILILLSVTYVATYLLPTVGRPENFTTLMSFLVYLLYNNRAKYNVIAYNSLICTLFALILSTQIICFFFIFTMFVIYELLDTKDAWKTLWVSFLRFVLIILIFCLVLSLSPNGLVNTINGIRLHLDLVLIRNDRSIPLFIHYWLLAPVNVGFLVIFVLCSIFYIKDMIVRLKNVNRMVASFAIALNIVIVYGIVKFIIYASPTVYNATEFILPMMVYLVVNIVSISRKQEKNTYIALLAATYLAGTIFFFREVILFIDYKKDGKCYNEAKVMIQKVSKNKQTIYITGGLWSLFDDFSNVKVFDELFFKKNDFIIVQQAYRPFPDVLNGKCSIIDDWSTTEKRQLLGIPMTRRPQGYSFVTCQVK